MDKIKKERYKITERSPFYNSKLQIQAVIVALDANAKLRTKLIPGADLEKTNNSSSNLNKFTQKLVKYQQTKKQQILCNPKKITKKSQNWKKK